MLAALERAHALAVGTGAHASTRRRPAFVRSLVRASPVPIVLDADGLNAFAGAPTRSRDRKAEAVITPHQGEFERLTAWARGRSTSTDRGGTSGLAADCAER